MSDKTDWVLVPREPTRDMVVAWTETNVGSFAEAYSRLLAAAPQPPAEAQAQGGGEVAEVRETQCSCHPQTCCCGDYMLWVHGVGLTTGYRDNMQTIADAINAKAAPPIAPVGVDGLASEWEKRAGELNDEGLYGCCAETYERCAAQVRALAQQPAAVDEAMVERAALAFGDEHGGYRVCRDKMRAALTAALAAQPGGAK